MIQDPRGLFHRHLYLRSWFCPWEFWSRHLAWITMRERNSAVVFPIWSPIAWFIGFAFRLSRNTVSQKFQTHSYSLNPREDSNLWFWPWSSLFSSPIWWFWRSFLMEFQSSKDWTESFRTSKRQSIRRCGSCSWLFSLNLDCRHLESWCRWKIERNRCNVPLRSLCWKWTIRELD